MKRELLATALAGLVAASASASGFQVNTMGQKNIGMAHTGTGLALDHAALFFNPGALAQLRSNGVQLGVSAVISGTTYRDERTFSTFETEPNTSTPFQFYGSYGFMNNGEEDGGRLRVGIGVYTPFGSTVEYPENWVGQYTLNQIQLRTIFIQPTASFAVTENLSIGAGVVFGTGGVNLQRSIPVSDQNGNPGNAELDGSASGIGYNVGVYFKPADVLSIGVSYRSKVEMKVKGGDATFNVPASLASNFSANQFDAMLPMPSSLNIGIGIMPSEKLTIAADVNFVGWNAYDSLTFEYKNGTVAGQTRSASARKYENSYAVRLGTQYMVSEALALRLGAYYDKTPVQAGFITAETPDSDRLGLSGGLGFKFGDNIGLDLSLLYIEGKERTQTDAEIVAAGTQGAVIAGTYKTKVLIPGIGVNINF